MTATRAEQDPSLNPDLVLEVWHRRKWVAIGLFAAGLSATLTAAASLPDLYRTSAIVLVDRQEVSEAFVRSSVTAELETRIQTIHQGVTSRERLADLIARMNLYPELRGIVPVEAIVDQMRRDIQLRLRGVDQSSGRSTTVSFTVGYSGRDPRTVAEVTNTLAGFYVEENTSSRERQASKTAEFLGAQLADVKWQLDEQERQTTDFTRQHTDELPDQIQANLATIERLNTQLRLNGEYQLRLLERRERLEQERAGTQSAAALGAGPAPRSEEQQLADLRRQHAALRRRFSDQYPDIRRLAAEIAALEAQVDRPVEDRARTVTPSGQAGRAAQAPQSLDTLEAEMRSLKQQEASLRRAIAGYEARVESAPRRQQEMQELSRGYELTRDRYQTLLKQYEAAQLAAALEQGRDTEQFRVLDPALPPIRPAAPNRLWLALMGLAGSLVLAVGAVILAERLDTTFHTADDLRAFVDVPMLAAIRPIPTREATRRGRRRLALATVLVVAGIGFAVAGTYYVAAGNERIVRLMMRPAGV